MQNPQKVTLFSAIGTAEATVLIDMPAERPAGMVYGKNTYWFNSAAQQYRRNPDDAPPDGTGAITFTVPEGSEAPLTQVEIDEQNERKARETVANRPAGGQERPAAEPVATNADKPVHEGDDAHA